MVELWFEFGSTYSYLAAHLAEEASRRAGVDLRWKPFLLGPLFRRQGWSDSPFNLFEVRGRYMWRDMERLCRKHGLPFRRPSVFPRNGLLAARVACAAEAEPWMPEFARRVFQANFARDEEISDPEVLHRLLAETGQDPAAVTAEAESPAGKARLREQTDRAWELGVFGAPTFVVEGEVFWGNDRMQDALDWATGAR